MVKLQEYLNQNYSDKEVKGIVIYCKDAEGELDLSNCPNLEVLNLVGNKLTSVDFLNTIPNPEKLVLLVVFNNNIQPTDISVFSKFVGLKFLRIGTTKYGLEWGKRNKFYGSLKSYQNLTKLEGICIEATDVDSGLEYLPLSLMETTQGGKYENIECSPHGLEAGCKKIQDQLRPFNYDLEAWQLAHPHKMYKARPEIFFDPELKTKWLTALRDKINSTQEKLNQTKQNEPQAVKRIKRLEMKLDNLKLIQENISNHALIDKLQSKELVKKEDKSTQTELVKSQNQETQTEELAEYQMPGSWPNKK